MEKLSQQQRRRDLIKSLLQLEDAQGETQKQSVSASQKQIENVTLQACIKQFDCQQIQSYPHIKINENIFCRFNHHKKAQFLCCSKYCDNHAIICGEQTCKCALDHHKCTYTSIESFIYQIITKTQLPIPKQIELYFQVKSVIYEHMVNRISKERQALMEWQQDIDNDFILFLYGVNLDQSTVCHAPKVAYHQKICCNHQKCCVPLQIRRNYIKEDKRQIIKEICKSIHKKYSSMINYLDQKVDQLQYHKKCANLNSAEFIFIDFVKHINAFIEKSEQKEFDSDEGLKEMKIISGRAIYLSRKYNKKQFKNFQFEKFSINRITRIWKGYSEKIFRSFVEGKAINELFCLIEKLEFLKVHSVQDLRYQIDKIIWGISQGQEYLFKKDIFTKKLNFKNLKEQQLCKKLKEYKGKEVKDVYINNKRQRLLRYKDFNLVQVYISNDKIRTALNRIETIKELDNLKNVTKLEIEWCTQMKAQVSMKILNTMPQLKHLALLHHCKKLSKNFMKKLCQFKQLELFYIKCNSQPQYYRSFNEYAWFVPFNILVKDNLPQIKELVELSKLPKLQNIEISLVNDINSAQVIKNIKLLRHLTLGYDWGMNDKVDAGLMKQLQEQRALTTLSLVGLKVNSKQVDHFITNNVHLKTIIIRNIHINENMSDGTVECMLNLIQLQNLCIQNNRTITGKHLSKLDKLIMLEIWNCQNVCKKEMKEALTQMHKLQHLQINENQWFDDEVVTSVQSCKYLAYLNIHSTQVSCEGLKHLEGLTHLKILICGYTKINGNDLIKLTKQTATITRLSINKLHVNKNNLQQIIANCQALTHLDIRYTNNKITAEKLLKIKELKVVRSFLNEDSINKLIEAGIQTYYY